MNIPPPYEGTLKQRLEGATQIFTNKILSCPHQSDYTFSLMDLKLGSEEAKEFVTSLRRSGWQANLVTGMMRYPHSIHIYR